MREKPGSVAVPEDADRWRLVGSVAELEDRFRVEIHAFVLWDNLPRLEMANLGNGYGHAGRQPPARGPGLTRRGHELGKHD